MVTKNAFQKGTPTTLLDEIMSQCTLAGWLNETIGSYTCTRDCMPPKNFSEIFTYEWSDEGSGDGSGDGNYEDCQEGEDCTVPIGAVVE